MKMKLLTIATTAIALSFTACSKSKTTAEKESGSASDGDAYPLTACVVSGEELGSMGKPIEVEHEGTKVKLCCKSCIPKFEKDPAGFVAKLTEK